MITFSKKNKQIAIGLNKGKGIYHLNNIKKLYLIILLGFGINIFMVNTLPVRGDEPYTILTSANGPSYAIEKAINFELQPPLYFFLVSIWRVVDNSITWARLFSVIFYPFIVLLSFNLAKNYIPKFNPLIFSAFIAFSPFIIESTSYARGYSLLLFLATALIVLYNKAYLREDHKKRDRVLYIIVSIFSLYTQYYFGFLLLAAGISLLLKKEKNLFKMYLIDMTLPVLSLIVLLPFLPAQINSVYDPTNKLHTFLSYLYFTSTRLETYLLPINELRVNFGIRLFLYVIIISVFIYSVYLIIKSKSYPNRNVLTIIGLLFVSSLFFLVILSIFGRPYLMAKHTAVIFVPLMLVFYVFINLVKNKKTRLLWYIIIFSIFSGGIIRNYTAAKEKRSTLTQAADYILSNEKKDEPIFLYNYLLQKFFPYYYKGSNTVIGLPKSIEVEGNYDISEWAYLDLKDIEKNWEQYKNLKTFWLITNKGDSDSKRSIDFHYNLLDTYINNNFKTIDDKNFGRFDVKKLSPLKTPAQNPKNIK